MTGIVLAVAFYLVGEFVVEIAALPVPGSVIGLLLLFCALAISDRVHAVIANGADVLLKLIPIFLIPIGVGIERYLFNFTASLGALIAVDVLALVISAAAVGLTASYLLRRMSPQQGAGPR
jgi:holin-like protein